MPAKKQLWETLNADGLYTKSFQEFESQFSNDQAIEKLHGALAKDKLYTKDLGSFKNQFFSDSKKKEPMASPSQRESQPTSLATNQKAPSPSLGTPDFRETLGPAFKRAEQERLQQTEQVKPARETVAKKQALGALDSKETLQFQAESGLESVEKGKAVTSTPLIEQFEPKKGEDSYLSGIWSSLPTGTLSLLGEAPETVKFVNDAIETGVAQYKLREIEKTASSGDFGDIDVAEIARANRVLQKSTPKEQRPFWQDLVSSIISSSISMAATAPSKIKEGVVGATAGTVLPGVGTAAGFFGGIAGGTSLGLEYSGTFSQALADNGYDVTNEYDLINALSDDRVVSKARELALSRGIPVATFDALTGAVAGKAYKAVTKSLATSTMSEAKKKAAAASAELVSESLLGATGELAGQISAGEEINVRDIALEGLSEFVVGGPSLTYQYMKSNAKTPSQAKFVDIAETDPYVDVKDFSAKITNPEIAKVKKQIDELTKIKEESVSETTKGEADKRINDLREEYYRIKNETIKSYGPIDEAKGEELLRRKKEIEQTIEDRNKATSEKEKQFLEEVLKKQKEEFTNAIQKQTTSEVPVQPEARVGEEMAQGTPQPEPQVAAEEIISQEEIATRQSDAESKIKRKDLFSDGGTFSNILGGSGTNSVPTSHSEINGIEFVQFSNPNTGQVDVIMTGTSDSDFVGFYRIYEDGKPTNKWSSKFENQSRNKENFKTMISGVQSMLPQNHQYTEKTSISTDGLRVWNQQLDRGYELQYDEDGNLVTNEVAINGDAIVNELGIDVNAGQFDNVRVSTKGEFDNVKAALLPYLSKFGLGENNIRWDGRTVKIDLPILKKKGKPQTEPKVITEEGVQEVVIERPKIIANTKPEIDIVTSSNIEDETGQTFNLDGTVYADGGLVVPLTSKNLPLDELTPEAIADFVEEHSDKIGDQTVKVGIYKFPNKREASIDINIVAPRNNREAAIEIGRMLGQESLFDLDTFENVKTGATGENPIMPTPEQFKEISKAIKENRVPQFLAPTVQPSLASNISKSIKNVFPDLNIVEVENTQQMREAVNKEFGSSVSQKVQENDAARVFFKDGKVSSIYINKQLSDETSLPHEVWHAILAKAFGQDENLFSTFRSSISDTLRNNGYSDIADKLDQFVLNEEYISTDTMAEEWLAQLGGMLTSANIDVNNLTTQQKTLLQQLKDVINEFANKVFGRPVFLEDATPQDILSFMTEISQSMAKGEDIGGYFQTEEFVKNTEDVFNSKAQKIGDFDIDYFEDAADFKNLEKDGYVIQNSSINKISGQPVAVHQPDSLLVGNVKYNGKQIIDGNGGVYYTLKFGNVWASGKKTSASGLAKLINKSRKNSSDGKGRLLLVMGSRDKMISSVQGVKASMEIIESLVFDGLIARSDFRKALTIAGKKYNIDFSGSDSSSAIKKDISDKFMNVNDSSFQRRGDFFSDLITEIGKTDSATKNIKKIQKALGATKNISFSKQGIRNQIGTVLSERLTQGVPSGNYYAYIEVDDDVDIIEDKQHESYPWSIVQKNGKRPVLHILNERSKATENISKEDGSPASNAELGLAQRGMGYGIVSKGITTKAQKAFDESINKEKENVKLNFDKNGILLAPNGNPSNLNEDLARYTRTTVFKEWFGDWEKDPNNSSKVIDENGEPLVVYHGSPFGGIETFNRKESVKVSSGLKEFGTYFTTNRNVADIYASEGKISQEKINEINQQINKLKQARDNTRNSNEYYNLEKEIEALEKNKSPKVYAAFLNLRSIKNFDAEQKSYPEAWRNLKVDAGYKTATDRDAMDFLKEGKFGVEKVDGIKASNIIDIISQGKKDIDFLGDVYLVFDSTQDAIRVVKDPAITTKAQKAPYVPDSVSRFLTEDENGNYVFHHYSFDRRDKIKPSSGSEKGFTSKEEAAALATVGGLGMYYTQDNQAEAGVGPVLHTVVVPKDKVYYMNEDPLNFYDEAKQRFTEYMNRDNPKDQWMNFAFSPNYQTAWITKVANENGFDMVVTKWRNNADFRAQSNKSLTPIDENIPFKKIDQTFEVGDLIVADGRDSVVTEVTEDGKVRYETPNSSGGFRLVKEGDFKPSNYPVIIEKGPFMVNKETMQIEKVSTKAQKIDVKSIPGYERAMAQIDGIITKSIERGNTLNQAVENAMQYLQTQSLVYQRANDSQREQMVRDLKKMVKARLKSAPSVERLFGIDDKKVTVSEKKALIDQIRAEAKAAKDAIAFVKELRQSISLALMSAAKRGKINASKVAMILKRYDAMNVLNPVMRERFFDYVKKAFDRADYLDRVQEANKLKSQIRKAAKSKDNAANMANVASDFAKIIPQYVENIDQYIEMANMVLSAVTRKAGPRVAFNEQEMSTYVNNRLAEQEEMAKEAFMASHDYLVEAGIIDKSMTLNEMRKLVEAIENQGASEDKAAKTIEALTAMYENMKPYLYVAAQLNEDPLTGESLDLSPEQIKLLKKMLLLDFSNLSLPTMYKIVEAANNFLTNGVVDGLASVVRMELGDENARLLSEAGVKSNDIKKVGIKGYGRIWARYLAPLPILNKLMWSSRPVISQVNKAMGLTDFMFGKAQAVNIANKAIQAYEDKFKDIKGFFDSKNVVERGMVAFMSRTVEGDQFQKQAEFNRRKELIEQTIEGLNQRTDDSLRDKAAVYQEIYDKVLSGSNSIEEVQSKASKINVDAVNWWIEEWGKHYAKMSEVSRAVYNTLLDRDSNYTPDRFQYLAESIVQENVFDSEFLANNDVVNTERSGSLMKNKRVNALPVNAVGEKTRVVNLDFDMVNSTALNSALVDIYTADSVQQIKGFLTSKSFKKLFASTETMDLYRARIIGYVKSSKGKGAATERSMVPVMRAINTLSSLGVTKALAKLTMPLVQTMPTFIYTIVKTRGTGLTEVFKSWEALSNSGLPISNRNIGSRAEVQSLNKMIRAAQDNMIMKGVDAIGKWNSMLLDITLQKPDAFAARAAWIAYYKQALKRKGVDVSNINWNEHKFDKDAAEFAEQQQTAHQNVNDTDMLGEFMTNPTFGVAIARKVIFPMMGFIINAKSRIWADARTVVDGKVSNQEKVDAGLGLAATVAELLVYRAIMFYVAEMWQMMSDWITGEEDDEEKKNKRVMNAAANTAGNIVNDLFVPPVPGLDIMAYKAMNEMFKATGLNASVPESLGLDPEKTPFRIYDKPSDDWFDQFGVIGILPSKISTLAEYATTAATGEVKKEVFGKETIKYLSEDDQQLAALNAALYAAYLIGAPADIDAIIRKNNKTIESRAMTSKQMKIIEKVGPADAKIMMENDLTSEKELMIFKAVGKKEYDDYKKRKKELEEERKRMREGL